MQHLSVVTTGGTIDKIYFDDKSAYEIGDPQIGKILDALGVAFTFDVLPALRKDSLHLDESDRDLLRRLIEAQPHSLDELAGQLAVIGAAVGHAEQGERLATRMRAGVAELAARHARAEPLTVFYQVWGRPMYTLGGKQIISDALRLCGARNVFGDLELPAPQVSVEAQRIASEIVGWAWMIRASSW